jgi:hypothetical protein
MGSRRQQEIPGNLNLEDLKSVVIIRKQEGLAIP